MEFFFTVAEHPHKRRVCLRDPSSGIDERDPGPGLLKDAAEPLLALPESAFSLLLLGDILADDSQPPGLRLVDVQLIPPPAPRLLQPSLHRDTRLRDLPVEGAGPLADRREDIKEPPPDQFLPAAAEEICRFLVQFEEPVVDGTALIVPDNLIEGVTLKHLLKEEAVLLLAPPEPLVCPHPLNSPAEPLGDGIDQGALFGEERPLIRPGMLMEVADLHPPGGPAVDDDRAFLPPGGLAEPSREILPVVESDPGDSILRVKPAGGEDGGDLLEDCIECYPGPLDDTGHGVEGRKFPNPVVQITSLHPEFLFRPPPVRDIVYDDDEPVVLGPVCPQLVIGVDIRAVDLAVHRRPGPRNPPAEVERNRTDRRDSRDEVFPGNLIPPAPESLFSLAVDLDDPEPGRFPGTPTDDLEQQPDVEHLVEEEAVLPFGGCRRRVCLRLPDGGSEHRGGRGDKIALLLPDGVVSLHDEVSDRPPPGDDRDGDPPAAGRRGPGHDPYRYPTGVLKPAGQEVGRSAEDLLNAGVALPDQPGDRKERPKLLHQSLQPLPAGDIKVDPGPEDDLPGGIPDRDAPARDGMVLPVRPEDAVVAAPGLTGRDSVLPCGEHRVHLLRMDVARPSGAPALLKRHPGKVEVGV